MLANIVKNEGLRGLWRGNYWSLRMYVPSQVLNLALKDQLRRWVGVTPKNDGFARFAAANVACGGVAGALTLAVMYPQDYARVRLATDLKGTWSGAQREYSGLGDVWRRTLRESGLAGMYRGFALSCAGVVVYRSVLFGLYDSLKPVLLRGRADDNFLAQFLLAWGAVDIAILAAYPIDTVRRRMLMAPSGTYRGAAHAFATLARTEGAAALFKGAGAGVLRGLAGAGTLACYDQLQRLLSYDRLQRLLFGR
jgi:solute carrier family 25 (adenine nucleotide translocator) protein 4/5/6/31